MLREQLPGFRLDVRKRADDPDETEGRAIYRAQADALARVQFALALRVVRRRVP